MTEKSAQYAGKGQFDVWTLVLCTALDGGGSGKKKKSGFLLRKKKKFEDRWNLPAE